MSEIKIDEEFKSLIPPLSDFERLQLEENLEKEGCRDPLITWQGILIDGHNRFEICERLGLEYSTREIVLKDRSSARLWIYRNQLGRRNLSPADASELRGLIYNSRKKTKAEAGSKGGASKAQNDTCLESTAEQVAAETGVSPATIKRDGEYAEAVAVVAKTDPEIREKVRRGEVKKKDVTAKVKRKPAESKPPANPEPERKSPTVSQVERTLVRLGRDKKRHDQLRKIASLSLHHLTSQERLDWLGSQILKLSAEDRERVYADVSERMQVQ